MSDETIPAAGRFDVLAIAAALPETAPTVLVDRYLTDQEGASTRVLRVYRPAPPHYHAGCDEHIYVLSGRGTFWIGTPSEQAEFRPGHLVVFRRGTVHAIPDLLEHPVVFLTVDTPRRQPRDVVFVDPVDGSPDTFVARNLPAHRHG